VGPVLKLSESFVTICCSRSSSSAHRVILCTCFVVGGSSPADADGSNIDAKHVRPCHASGSSPGIFPSEELNRLSSTRRSYASNILLRQRRRPGAIHCLHLWKDSMAPVAGQKRKVDYHPPGTVAQARKRQKGKDARAIPTQTADAALSTTGELNITSFVKAREFEIAALDSSMKKARKSLTQRAFQQVPRHMRRRTASHNVKKIPRRLRGRAAREVWQAAERVTPILTG